MNEEQKLNIPADDAAASSPRDSAEKARADRIKRMRGWMGVKSAVETHCIVGNSDPLIEVDAPNGWNR